MFVFLHIPKTGGVSIGNAIARGVLGTLVLRNQSEFDALTRDRAVEASAICGHIPAGLEAWIPGPHSYATMLRDPLDRIMSAYWFAKSLPTHPPFAKIAKRSFEEWALDPETRTTDNMLVRRLLDGEWPPRDPGWALELPRVGRSEFERARETVERCAFVGRYERFADDAPRIVALAGSHETVGIENVTPGRPPVESIQAALADVIRERNRWDYELLNFANRHQVALR